MGEGHQQDGRETGGPGVGVGAVPRPLPDERLDAACAAARSRYVAARPASAAWAERARRVLPGGSTRTVLDVDPFPLRITRAEGKHLWDVDGHRYVDLLGNYTAGLLGHSPRPVLDAVRAAVDGGWSLGGVHGDEVVLAELLVDRFASIEEIRFTNSGTEANLMALALATHHTGRRTIVVFEHGYHGGVLTFGAGPGPVTVPHDWLVLPYNDTDAVTDAFDRRGNEIAAVLVEPMQGSAGCLPGERSFLSALRDLCADHGSLLVFDEVMTSRTSPGGAQAVIGVTPDLTTLGKYLAGGFSFGAFGGRHDLMAHFDPHRGGGLGHAGTFNNNVVSMAAGVAALTHLVTADALADVAARGDRLRDRLNGAFRDIGLPMCATGAGSMLNVHGTPGPVRSGRDLVDADDRWRELLYFTALESGLHLARRGFIALSFEIDDGDVDAAVDVVAELGVAVG
jgi:glutamate-1-semialdehyde 2,1-aminomutase